MVSANPSSVGTSRSGFLPPSTACRMSIHTELVVGPTIATISHNRYSRCFGRSANGNDSISFNGRPVLCMAPIRSTTWSATNKNGSKSANMVGPNRDSSSVHRTGPVLMNDSSCSYRLSTIGRSFLRSSLFEANAPNSANVPGLSTTIMIMSANRASCSSI